MCFKGTASRIGGVGFERLGMDCIALHDVAYKVRLRVRVRTRAFTCDTVCTCVTALTNRQPRATPQQPSTPTHHHPPTYQLTRLARPSIYSFNRALRLLTAAPRRVRFLTLVTMCTEPHLVQSAT